MLPLISHHPTPRVARRGLLALVLAALGLDSAEARAEAEAPSYVVIVHPNNPHATASREFLAAAFLKKSTRWQNGEPIRPVDLRADSWVRRKFSEAVLRRSVPAVRNYWQQRIFSGRDVPPPEFDSDEAILQYVATHVGAVGYVSTRAQLKRARVLIVH